MALEQLVNGMTGQQLANTIKNNFDKVLDVESAENKAENAGKALKTDYDATRYVEMELADGTPIRMRWNVFCQAIASVVAGLAIGQNLVNLFKYDYKAPSDLNEVLYFSMGSLPPNTINAPTTNYLYFLCIKVSSSNQYIQICFDYWKQTYMYVRNYNNGSWANWAKYAGVELA